GFELSAGPGKAVELWRKFNGFLKEYGVDVKEGVFGARMDVCLINSGPVTICLES
ncbi:MAG: D-aminoacyl-tRNA deacylase, partial [Candidatus Omnitrophota bacterium]